MQFLMRLVFAQSFLIINFKICSSKIYLEPDVSLDYQDVLDSAKFPEKNSFTVSQNDNFNPADKSNRIKKVWPIQGYKLAKMYRNEKANDLDDEENDIFDLPDEIIDISDLESEDFDASDLETQENDDSDLEISDLNLNYIQKSMLRERWRNSCDKKASRTCTKACKNAYKIVCSSYNCRRKMKRDFKKECRRNCRSKFVESVSSAETSD